MEEKQTEKTNSLWNYLSLSAYKLEFLKAIGLMDEKELNAFIKAYRSEIDLPDSSSDLEISISFDQLPKMIKRWPRFKEQLNFLSLAAVPLQMKMLNLKVMQIFLLKTYWKILLRRNSKMICIFVGKFIYRLS